MTKLGKSGLSCVLCKVDNLSGVKLYDMLGAICDKCDESGRADKVKNRLVKMYKAKSIESYPDDMDARDFDRIALQASLTYLSFDKFREKMREVDVNPLMYMPSQFALSIKEKIIDLLPSSVVSTVNNHGRERWFSGGTYCFEQDTVPKEMIIEALMELQIPLPIPESLLKSA